MSITKRIVCFVLAMVLLTGLVPAANAVGGQAEILACVIDPQQTQQVTVTVQIPSGIQSDDGKLYLFAVAAYEDGISGHSPVAEVAYSGSGTYQIAAPLQQDTANSLLYSRFYVAAKDAGEYSTVAGGYYITNPEVIAPSGAPRTEAASKKGIHMTMSIPTELEELGIRHSYFGIVFQDFISNTPTDISYTYCGKTYYFTNVVKDYDVRISNMSRAGIVVTVGLTNEYRLGYEYLIHPDAQYRADATNYALNTTNQQGMDAVIAATHFLAERYNGSNAAYGKVDNWIVGNEVNDNLHYYNMGEKELTAFVQDYQRSFRAMYTAIKSGYANANVYICLENRWNVPNSTGDYAGKDFIDLFNQYVTAQGNIDWGLSFHPYSFPANDPEILNDGASTLDQNGTTTDGGEVRNDLSTPIITMKNLNVLTDYFHNPALRNPDGQVRSIILGEQGYTSYSNLYGSNEARQAANIALAYYIAQANPDVDAFHLRTLTDENEGNPYFRFGIREEGPHGYPGDAKLAWEMYKYIDTADSLAWTEFAKTALNISDWSEVVPNWNPGVFTAMGIHYEEPLYAVTGTTPTTQLTTGMLNQWEVGYNVFSLSEFDYEPKYHPEGVAVVNSFAYYRDYQGVEKHFDAPVNLESAGYLTMDVHVKPMDASGAADRLEVLVRLHSGNDVLDATGIVDVNKDYTLCLDIGSWEGRKAIDTIEVMIRAYGAEKSFAGTFSVYRVTGASAVSGMQALPGTAKTYTDLSRAELAYQQNFNHTGAPVEPTVTVKCNGQHLVQHEDFDVIYHNNVNAGEATLVVVGIGNYTGIVTGSFTIQGGYPTVYQGVDYAAVYSYGYYKEHYPQVVAEVGDDPEALLEHFVTKGMAYALQGVGSFNVLAYAKINGDLVAEFGDDWTAYYMHYLTHGIAEGRPTSGQKPADMEAPVYPGTPAPPPEDLNCDAGHHYDDNVDGTCNVCGINRADVERRVVVHMFRMYNPNTGEHFYTGSTEERDNLIAVGWQYEGIGFTFPANTGAPVHRLFQPSTGEHLYTMDEAEKDRLMAEGWNYEGIAFNSAFDTEAVQHRLHNPNASVGAYHFTFSLEERDTLIAAGWEYQGIGWYSCWK